MCCFALDKSTSDEIKIRIYEIKTSHEKNIFIYFIMFALRSKATQRWSLNISLDFNTTKHCKSESSVYNCVLQNAPEINEEEGMNPYRPADLPLVNAPDSDDVAIRKRVQRVTSPEKWELKQVSGHIISSSPSSNFFPPPSRVLYHPFLLFLLLLKQVIGPIFSSLSSIFLSHE